MWLHDSPGTITIEAMTELVVSAAEMRAIETEAVSRGATWEGLMDLAGEQVARHAIRWLGSNTRQRVLVLTGPGNNGGDGLVVARHLHDHGWDVRCLTWSRSADKDSRLLAPLKERGVGVKSLAPADFENVLDDALDWCTVVVDGIFGTGLQREITGPLAEVIKQVGASDRPVIAVDIPSGVDSDTGAVHGVALGASLTVAIGDLKYGHVLQPGARLSGTIMLGDIGLATQESTKLASGEMLTGELVRGMLPDRPPDANKGTFGKAMIVAGSINYIGAPALATEGALRSGAGLVTLACPGDLLPILAVKLTECTYLPLPSDMGSVASHAVERLRQSIDDYKALLVGCGLGKERETIQFVHRLLSSEENVSRPASRPIGFATKQAEPEEKKEDEHGLPPLVLDGDALNILSEWEEWWTHAPENCVLTPHPGEMARLLDSTIEEVQKDRVGNAREAGAKWKQVVVLKGAGTVIASPDGKVYVSPFSNPALATAGSGDVLAGAIAGFLAQGLGPREAAAVGVFLHGLAGELLKEEFGVAGGLSGDLPLLLARAQKRVREGQVD